MKNLLVVVLMVAGLVVAGAAEAAKPKKRTRNANRVGPYVSIVVDNTHFTDDQASNEAGLDGIFNGFPNQNKKSSTDYTDLGYQAAFGYRFKRYFSAEIALVQYGKLTSQIKGEIDGGDGFVPSTLTLEYTVGGPIFSATGYLPLGEKFELFGRAGALFASVKRDISWTAEGGTILRGSAHGDDIKAVFTLGMTYHINQAYSIRAEVQKIPNVGDSATGTESMTIAGIGMVVRF